MRKRLGSFLALIFLLSLCLPDALASTPARTYSRGSADEHRVAITVDDVFNTEWLERILDLCDQYNVKITVFPVGKVIREEDGDLWRRVLSSGHEIGSHTNNHRKLTRLTGYQIRDEMRGFTNHLNAALGYEWKGSIMRPPYGSLGECGGASHAGIELYKLGYHALILWNVSNTDPEQALKQTKNGSILLFHTKKKDFECLETLIPALLDQGYELVTVSDLLHLDENGDPITPEATAEPEATLTPEASAEPGETSTAEATSEPTATSTAGATVPPHDMSTAEALPVKD